MANSYTSRLKKRLPTAGDPNWDDEWHDNEKIDEVVLGALLSTNRVISGGVVTDGGGLTADWAEIVARLLGEQLTVADGSSLMTASQANWLYIDANGDVVTSLTPPSGSYIPLALVDTNSDSIVRIADLRPIAEVVELNKDLSDGVPGLTGLLINFMNAHGTIKSFFANANTAPRIYTFQDRNGTIADDTDLSNINTALADKAPLASPALTGTPTAPTPDAGDNSTELATTAYVQNELSNITMSQPIFQAQDQKAYNVDGGSSVADTWTKRSLNTVVQNDIPGASLVSDEGSVPAGTYEVESTQAFMPDTECNIVTGIFVNGSKLHTSVTTKSVAGNGVRIFVSGEVVLAAPGVIGHRYHAGLATPTNGLGRSNSGGSISDASILSIYSDLKIRKIG